MSKLALFFGLQCIAQGIPCQPQFNGPRDVTLDVRTHFGESITGYTFVPALGMPGLVPLNVPVVNGKLRLRPGTYAIELNNLRSQRYSSWTSRNRIEVDCHSTRLLYLTKPGDNAISDGANPPVPEIRGSIQGADRAKHLWIQLVGLYHPDGMNAVSPVEPDGRYLLLVLQDSQVLKTQEVDVPYDGEFQTGIVIKLGQRQ